MARRLESGNLCLHWQVTSEMLKATGTYTRACSSPNYRLRGAKEEERWVVQGSTEVSVEPSATKSHLRNSALV